MPRHPDLRTEKSALHAVLFETTPCLLKLPLYVFY